MNEVEELKKKLSEAQAEAALNAKKLSDTENQLKTAKSSLINIRFSGVFGKLK